MAFLKNCMSFDQQLETKTKAIKFGTKTKTFKIGFRTTLYTQASLEDNMCEDFS